MIYLGSVMNKESLTKLGFFSLKERKSGGDLTAVCRYLRKVCAGDRVRHSSEVHKEMMGSDGHPGWNMGNSK